MDGLLLATLILLGIALARCPGCVLWSTCSSPWSGLPNRVTAGATTRTRPGG